MPPKKLLRSAPPPPPPAAALSLSMSSDSESELSLEPMVLLPPDGGYGWVVVAACFVMNLCTDGAIYTFGVYQKSVQEDFARDSAAVALLASLCSGFYYVSAPLWSAVGNRWGFRAVSLLGAVASAGAFAACFFITEYALFIFVYGVVLGAASGGVYMATVISVGFYFERWRGVATSLTSCGSGVGILVMPMCFKAMSGYDGFSWRWIMAFNASVFGVVLVLSLLLRPLQPIPVSMVRAGERTVRFKDEEELAAKKAKDVARAKQAPANLGLRQLHTSQTSFSPSVKAPQFDAISMTSRAFPRTGPDARDMQGGSRPMYRDDIFYGAGASRLSSQMSTRVATALPTADAVQDAEEADEAVRPEARRAGACGRWCKRVARCRLCPHAVTSTLTALLHHSILTNSVFLVFAIAQVLVMFGYFTPFLFSQDQALKAGVPAEVAEWILPSIGVANAVGRGLSGIACEVPGVSALVLSCAAMTAASVIVAATCASANPAFQLFASSAYGFLMAPFMAMKSLILVEFLGIEKLTNSFGLLLMFQGVAVMMGPPMSGWIYESTKSYNYVYIISGSLLFVASLLPYLMYPLSNYELKKEMKQASRRSS